MIKNYNAMKRFIFILGSVVLSVLSAIAQSDTFPAYETTDYQIAIDYRGDSVYLISEDSLAPHHRMCNAIMYYEVHGMKPTENHQWIDVMNGTQNADIANTPPALLCKLLKAYHHGSITELSQVYLPEHREEVNYVYSVDTVFARWNAFAAQINNMELLLTYSEGNSVIAFV